MTRPRSAGAARCAASGSATWGTTVKSPTRKLATPSQASDRAAATPSSAAADAAQSQRMSALRSTASPSGMKSSRPTA
jgi:hypothetical protein